MISLAAAQIKGPPIDYASLSPIMALAGGGLFILLLGLLRPRAVREQAVPVLTMVTFAAAIALMIWRFNHHRLIISGALVIDDLSLILGMMFCAAGLAAVLMSWRARAPGESGHGEYHAVMIFSVLGMLILVAAHNLITLFIGFELLSIPLYVLTASEFRREGSLEAGLKYLVIGSVGSATLVYGLALVYGATGSTDYTGIASALSVGRVAGGVLGDPLLYAGLGLVIVGFAFKSSIAPFHQWTPDVYEGAPTPVTAFMATATKAAALGVFLRFFLVAAPSAQGTWAPIVAGIATTTMIVGNVGALGQSSLKRMLGYSGVAQAGYMLTGLVVGTQLGVSATVLYLIVYLFMNLAAFGVIAACEHGDDGGDDISVISGLGRRNPWLAWPMTIAMLALAGIPGTVGFIGKFQLIHALVDGNYTWLAIVLVVGSMISLGYYLRVLAAMWMRGVAEGAPVGAAGAVGRLAPIAGGSPEADEELGRGGLPRWLPPIAGGAPEGDGEPGGDESLGDRGPLGDREPLGSESGPLGGNGASDAGDGRSLEDGDEVGVGSGPGGGSGGRGRRRLGGGILVPTGDGPTAARPGPKPELTFMALAFAAASVFFGIVPQPLFTFTAHAGHAIAGIF